MTVLFCPLGAVEEMATAPRHQEIEEEEYPTDYDGQENWQCFERLCPSGQSLVRCTGNWGHDYALPPNHYEITSRVAYKFMMNHPRKR